MNLVYLNRFLSALTATLIFAGDLNALSFKGFEYIVDHRNESFGKLENGVFEVCFGDDKLFCSISIVEGDSEAKTIKVYGKLSQKQMLEYVYGTDGLNLISDSEYNLLAESQSNNEPTTMYLDASLTGYCTGEAQACAGATAAVGVTIATGGAGAAVALGGAAAVCVVAIVACESASKKDSRKYSEHRID